MTQQKLTILHSNDMHGDFLAEVQGGGGRLLGGLALLSGYVNQVRREEPNTLFAIAGDMLQGSVIDSEYRGISTIEIMNFLSPDVVSLGNHEFGYGVPHLLFLEKVANFPIVNANLYLKNFHKRLMRPHLILKKNGLKILFIGIITDKILADLATDQQIASFITLAEARDEVGRICDAYKTDDIDLTVLLTHIGFDSDRELAALLRPEWGVDLIIGGHSHTVLQQPDNVNGILIAQAGVGTDQIGRFDLMVDDETNSIASWQWKLIPITSDLAAPDPQLEQFIDTFKSEVDRKYNTVLCRFAETLTHPHREIETALGNFTADAVADSASSDIILMGSGFIRQQELGPVVTLGDIIACFPFQEALIRITITGEQVLRAFSYIMRAENRNGEGECYQVNHGVVAVYNEAEKRLVSLSLNGEPVDEFRHYTVALPVYHYNNIARFLSLTPEEVIIIKPPRVVATSIPDVLEEYLRTHQNLTSRVEGRLVYLGAKA